MLRINNNRFENNILFIGKSQLIIKSGNKELSMVDRTITVTEKAIQIYDTSSITSPEKYAALNLSKSNPLDVKLLLNP
jgi:hypothetical protein